MKVINLFSGPGSGKSTSAAALFAYWKQRHCNVELIREEAKTIVYERSPHILDNQIYVTALQYKQVKDIQLYQQVPLVVTDSPLLLGLYYCQNKDYYNTYVPLLHSLNNQFENINVFVNRVKPYNPSGRLQTEEESDDISKFLMKTIAFDYRVDGDAKSIEQLAETLYNTYLA